MKARIKSSFFRLFSPVILLICVICAICGLTFAQSSVPSSYDFPAGVVGVAESGTFVSTFTNTWGSTISNITVNPSGTNYGDFGVVTSPATNCGGSLAAGATCTITTTFTPGGLGARSAIITIGWTGNALSPFTMYLTGTGVSGVGPSNAAVAMTTTAYTNNSTGFTNVIGTTGGGGLTLPLSAFQNFTATCRITWQGSASTAGPKYQVTGPSSPTAVAIGLNSPITAATAENASAVAFSSAVANAGAVTATTNFTDTLSVAVVNGANAGAIYIQAAANGSGTLTIQPGSYCVAF